jgi:hypothetical protein
VTAGVVAEFQGELAFERLPICKARLCLDAGAPSRGRPGSDLCVPRTQIALDGERDLRVPAKRGVETPPQSLQQRELRSVADRVACRVRPNRQIKAHDGTPCPKLGERHAIQSAALEAQQLLVRSTRHVGAVPQTQTRSHPCQTMLFARPDDVPSGSTATSIGTSIVRSHLAILPEAALPPLTSAFGPPRGATGERHDSQPSIGPRAGPPSGGRARNGRSGPNQPLIGPPAGPRAEARPGAERR